MYLPTIQMNGYFQYKYRVYMYIMICLFYIQFLELYLYNIQLFYWVFDRNYNILLKMFISYT